MTCGDSNVAHSSRRRIGLHITADTLGIDPERGIVLAPANDHCDFEIELSGVCGNHVVRLNLADPESTE